MGENRIRKMLGIGTLAGAGLFASSIHANAVDTAPTAKKTATAPTDAVVGESTVMDFLNSMPVVLNAEDKKSEFKTFAHSLALLIKRDRISRSTGGAALIPDEAIEKLVNLPLRALTSREIYGPGEQDELRIYMLCGALLENLSDKPIAYLTTFPAFTEIVVHPALSPSILKPVSLNEDGVRQALLENITIHNLRLFGMDGWPVDNNKEELQKLVQSYNPTQRAADVISRNMQNPWQDFTNNGLTVIPYSFNIDSNDPLKINPNGIEASEYSKFKPVNIPEPQRDEIRLMLKRIAEVSALTFKETDVLPKLQKGFVTTPRSRYPVYVTKGLLLYNSEFPVIELNKETGKKMTPAGMAQTPGNANAQIIRSDILITGKDITCREGLTLHEIGHGAFRFSHPFDPNGTPKLPGTSGIAEKSSVPIVTTSNSVMAYDETGANRSCAINLMAGDIIALQRIFGPAKAVPHHFTLEPDEIPIAAKLAKTDPSIHVSSKRDLSQSIIGHSQSTLDMRMLDGKPVVLPENYILDLSSSQHKLVFQREDGTQTASIFLNTVGEIPNAIIHAGTLSAARQGGRIEVETRGTLRDHSGGNIMVGGTQATEFVRTIEPLSKPNQYIVRALKPEPGIPPAEDMLIFPRPDDKVIAPSGTAGMTALDGTQYNDCVTQVSFMGTDGEVIKKLNIVGSDKECSVMPQFQSENGFSLAYERLQQTPYPLDGNEPRIASNHTHKVSHKRASQHKNKARH